MDPVFVVDIAGNEIPVIPKKYDQNKYNRVFIEKNLEKIHEKRVCDVCCGTYTYFNKSKHLKSKKHLDLLHKLANPPQPI
jgi:hypothetical protein